MRSPGYGRRLAATASVAALAGAVLSACSSSDQYFVIGAFNFGESQILSQVYSLALEDAAVNTRIKDLTTREVLSEALKRNQLQMVPEYLGTFTEYLNVVQNGPDAPAVATADTDQTYAAAQPMAAQWGITLLTPSPAQDQNAFATTQAYADEHNLTTLSQLGAFTDGNPIVLGGPPECQTRPFCMPGLEQTYGIEISDFVALDAGGPLTVQALVQDKIQLGLVFSSSGSIETNDLAVLADDKGLQKADNIVPALNAQAVTPVVKQTLNEVSAALTTEELQQMNAAVEVDREDPKEVAQTWLLDEGLISE